jgi:hypothetical protein
MRQSMNVTDEMVQAAIKKAIEAGLLPRHACREEAEVNKELVRLVVQAALKSSTDRESFVRTE